MVKKGAIIYLLLFSFLLPTSISLTAYFASSKTDGKLVMSILGTAEEETNEQEKNEKEKEKQLPAFEFIASLFNPGTLLNSYIFLQSKALKGILDFPTPPPKKA